MKNTIFSKKNIFKIFIIFSFISIAMTFGCSKVFDKTDDYVGPKDKARITISTTSSSRSAIAPEEYEETITSIILTGKLEGQDKGEIKKWEMQGVDDDGDGEIDYNESAYYDLFRNPIVDDLDIGNWEFTLTCYIYEIDSTEFNEIPVYEAKAEKNLKAGDNGSIRFTPSGKGRLNISLSMDDTLCEKIAEKIDDKYYIRSNYTVTVQLKTLDGTPVDGTEKNIKEFIKDGYYYYAYYENEEVPAGSYIMFLTVQGNGKNEKTIATELVHISSYLITEGEAYLPYSLNESYKINYYVENGNAVQFNEDWWVSKETIPRTFTEYDKIGLPTAFDILRDADVDGNGGYTGYYLNEWTSDSNPYLDYIANQTSDIDIYADFFELLTRGYPDNFYLGLEKPTEFDVDFYVNVASGYPLDYWYEIYGDKIIWSSSDNDTLQLVEQTFVEKTAAAGAHFKLKAKALKPTPDGQKVSLIAKIGDKVIGGKTVVISEILDSRAADALIAELPDEATIFTIPDGYTYIGYEAFKGKFTDKVTSIVIPKSVTSIGSSAFSSCNSLESVYMLSNEPPELGSDVFLNCNNDLKIYVPEGSAETYKNNTNWSAYGEKISEK